MLGVHCANAAYDVVLGQKVIISAPRFRSIWFEQRFKLIDHQRGLEFMTVGDDPLFVYWVCIWYLRWAPTKCLQKCENKVEDAKQGLLASETLRKTAVLKKLRYVFNQILCTQVRTSSDVK